MKTCFLSSNKLLTPSTTWMKSQKHNVKCKKPDTKEHILSNLIYMKFKKQAKLTHGHKIWNSGCYEGLRIDWNGAYRYFLGDAKFDILIWAV